MTFPPKTREVPEGYWKNGQGSSEITSCWGKVGVATQRLKHSSGKQRQMYQDAELDASGFSPQALRRLLDLTARLPFEEAASVATGFGLHTSASELERLSCAYAGECKAAVTELLVSDQEGEETGLVAARGRTMVLQVDGVYTLGRPEQGVCPGVEVKSVVLYPESAPAERWMLADVICAESLLPQLAGLLKQAKVTPKDTLIGLGDGAAWVENIFYYLDAVHITDVYHACEYLDLVIQALGWDEPKRTQHRRDWYRGEVSAKAWLETYLPDPEVWLTWNEAARNALAYLEKRLASMDYPTFKAKDYPIGSGQVEAMNKSVIGNRMKRSGMHWSREGAARMASLRAQFCAKHPLVNLNQLRHRAYPPIPA